MKFLIGTYFIVMGIVAWVYTCFIGHSFEAVPYFVNWCLVGAPIGSIGFGINLLLES